MADGERNASVVDPDGRHGDPEHRPGGRRPGGRRSGGRRPGRFRRWILRPVFWGLALVALVVFLLQLWVDTPRAREHARRYLVEELSAAFDRPVELRDVRFHLLPFHLELWEVKVAGGPEGTPESAETFLHLPYVYAEADLEDLRNRRLHLQLLRLERPRVDLRFYSGGGDNLVGRDGEPSPSPFELWIDQVEVDRATVDVDHERAEITVDAERLRTRLRGLGDGRLAGDLNARSVRVTLPDSDPMGVAVVARGVLAPGSLEVEHARILSRRVDARVTGGCDWARERWEQRSCTFQTRGSARGGALRELGYFRSLYGDFTYDGVFAWRPDAVGWRGDVAGDDFLLWGRRVRGLRGRLSADRFRVVLGVDRARYADGELSGQIEADLAAPGDPVTADLELEGLHLDTLLEDQSIPVEGLAGRVDGRLRYTCDLRRGLRGQGFAEVEVRPDPEDPGLPVEGSFPLRVDDGWVFADSVDVTSRHQSLLANGAYHLELDRGRFDYDVTTTDVAELISLLPLEDPPSYMPTAGTGSLVGSLQVQSGFAYNTLELELDGVESPLMPSTQVSGRLDVTPWALENVHLDLKHDPRIPEQLLVVRGRLPWGAAGLARLTFDAADWPMVRVHPWLTFDLPLDGRVSGRLELELDGESRRGTLSASLEPAAIVTAGSELPLSGVVTELRWDDESLELEALTARAEAGTLDALGKVDLVTGDMDLRLWSAGLDVGAPPLAAFLPRPDVHTTLVVEAHLAGRAEDPRWNVTLEADRLTVGDREVVGSPGRLDAFWQDGRLEVGGRLLDVAEVEGGGTLDARTVDLAFEVRSEDLGRIVPLATPVEGRLGGDLAGVLTVRGERGGPLTPVLELDRLHLDVDDRRLEARPPVVARFFRDRWRLDRLDLQEPATGSGVLLQGRLGYETAAPVDLDLQADLDGSWIRTVLPDLELDGRLGLEGKVAGTLESPRLSGTGTLDDGRLDLPGLEEGFRDMSGTVRFYGDRVSLEQLAGRLSGGTARLTGELSWAGEGPPAYRLDLTAERASLRSVEGWSLAGDASLALRSVPEGHLLSGNADLDRLTYREDLRFDAARLLRQILRGRRLEVEAADDQLASIALQVRIQAPGNVVLRNNVADMTGSADLQLRGNLAQPVLFGELTMDRGGRMVYNSTDYRLERGRLVFADPYRLDPEVDLVAVTEIRDFDVTLSLSGPLDRLEARFSSEPPLPDVEVLRLLAGGDTYVDQAELVPDPGSRLDQEEENSAATFLYGQAASAIGDRVNSLFGFDQFRIDPLTGSGDNLSRARFTVGKRLSKDVFVTYSVDPSSSDNQRIRVEWQLTDSLVLVLTQNGDDTFAADARWETTF